MSSLTGAVTPPMLNVDTFLILTAMGTTRAFWIVQFLMIPSVGLLSWTSKGKVNWTSPTVTVALTVCFFDELPSSLSTTSSTSSSEVADAMTWSVKKTRSSLATPGSTIAVAALAFPCAR